MKVAVHEIAILADSDLIHLDACGTSVIVINSYEAVVDLFEKRSSLYADRWVL